MKIEEWKERIHKDDLAGVEEILDLHKNGRILYVRAEYLVTEDLERREWFHELLLGQIHNIDDPCFIGTVLRGINCTDSDNIRDGT